MPPPGIAFLLRKTPTILGPSIVVYALVNLLSIYVQIPFFLPLLLSFLTIPTYITISIVWSNWKNLNERKRNALGATPIPRIKDNLFGFNLLKEIRKSLDEYYPSKCPHL